jgi:hypothetical protein
VLIQIAEGSNQPYKRALNGLQLCASAPVIDPPHRSKHSPHSLAHALCATETSANTGLSD